MSIDPGNAQALAYLGDIEMRKNNPEKALSYLHQAVQARNDLRIAYIDMGAVLVRQKQYKEAIAPLKRALELDPTQPDAHYRLGRIYQAIGNRAAAQQEFKKVQQLHQNADEDFASKMAAPPTK